MTSPAVALDGRAAPASSWVPIDLKPILSGDLQPLEPTLLTRSDGVKLLYPGRAHSVFGAPEAAKSWLGLIAVIEVLRQGQAALYIDFESEPVEIVLRLLALGADRQTLAELFGYVRPAEPLGDHTVKDLLINIEDAEPGLVVLDGINSALTREGAELNSNKDFVGWWQRLVLPLQRVAPEAVLLTVDQVSKDKDARDYAIGASQKLALIDGSAFRMTTIKPFGRGMQGEIQIDVTKDRPGALRQHANGSQIASLKLGSLADGSVSWELVPASREGGGFRPTVLMEKVSLHLLLATQPLSGNAIVREVGGRKEYVLLALQLLIVEGYVSDEAGPRGRLHRSLKPFMELQQPQEPVAEQLELGP